MVMAGSNRNLLRRKIILEYGMEYGKFHIDELYTHMNNYKTQEGRPHKQVSISRQQLTSLLRTHALFMNMSNGYWKFTGDKHVMDREI